MPYIKDFTVQILIMMAISCISIWNLHQPMTCWFYLRKFKQCVCIFCNFQHWKGACSWSPSTWKTQICNLFILHDQYHGCWCAGNTVLGIGCENQDWSSAGVYTKFSGRLSEDPFPWLIQKFPCLLIFKTGQPGCQLNLSEGQIRLDLTSGRSLV